MVLMGEDLHCIKAKQNSQVAYRMNQHLLLTSFFSSKQCNVETNFVLVSTAISTVHAIRILLSDPSLCLILIGVQPN